MADIKIQKKQTNQNAQKKNSQKNKSKSENSGKKEKITQKNTSKVQNQSVKNAKKQEKSVKKQEKKPPIYKKIGYTFKDRNLLIRALTHPSKSKENYQRLEFLGDSILNFLVGEFLFKNSNGSEGDLTVLRAHFVSEEHLSECFDEISLSEHVICGRSLNEVTRAIKGDVMESIIAAIYLDSGMDEARKFVIQKLHVEEFANVPKDNYKTLLQELIQANFKCTMKYHTTQTTDGFEAEFYMDDDLISKGYGRDKIHAEQNCAMVAMKKLFEEDEE